MMITSKEVHLGKILIVDDQAANVLLLERVVRGDGYVDVTTTTQPSLVAALHKEHQFDLILLDLLMPLMDGFEVMERLKAVETTAYLPVLVITAEPGLKIQALRSGAKDFLSKPLDLADVLVRVYNMLEVRLLHARVRLLQTALNAKAGNAAGDVIQRLAAAGEGARLPPIPVVRTVRASRARKTPVPSVAANAKPLAAR